MPKTKTKTTTLSLNPLTTAVLKMLAISLDIPRPSASALCNELAALVLTNGPDTMAALLMPALTALREARIEADGISAGGGASCE